MAQSFDTDVIPKLQAVIDLFEGGTVPKMREGLANTVEVAKDTGSEKLQKTAEAAYQASESVIRNFESLIACIDRYMEQNKRLEANL